MYEENITTPLETMRHSCAHLMAAAIQEVLKEEGITPQFAIGPVVENGFYYDMDLGERRLTEADFSAIEKKMKFLVKRGLPIERSELPVKKALEAVKGQKYKTEIINDLAERGEKSVSFYSMGDVFTDLCRGPHVASTAKIGAFKLTKVAGAYWRADQSREQLQRMYGVCFETQEDLDVYLKQQEEAEKRDHRKLGVELDLFSFSPLVGSGLPLFTPRGTLLRDLLANFVMGLQTKYGFERVWIPHITKSDLYKTSGHWEKFEDDLFHVTSKKSEDIFVLKPMNCPHHTQIYASKPRSYRDLPIRYAEVTTCYRDENTGQLQGLTRVRSLTQDDAHMFCTMEQVPGEIRNVYQVIREFYLVFNMGMRVRLSTHNPKNMNAYLGGADIWDRAEAMLRDILEEEKLEYETGVGEAAFYGPKLDFISKDALGREWQLATIQLDFNQPERFGLSYTDSDGKEKRPVMIHRAILGSIERFMGVLIEHYAGAFPLWLSPVQVRVLPVSDKFINYAREVTDTLRSEGIRTELDDSNESLGKKIRNGEKEKTPYLLIIGEKEVVAKQVAVRKRGHGDMGGQLIIDFIQSLKKQIVEKS